MKRLTVLLTLALVVAVLVAGCGSKAQPTATQPAAAQPTPAPGAAAATKHYTFGASYFTLNNPHFLDWRDGLISVFGPNGDTLINADAQLNINKQIADVEDMIQQKVDAIFIAPADSKAIKTALLSAQKAGIPVIIMDVPVEDTDLVVSTISTNNVMAGQVLGEAMVKDFGGKANVAILDWPVVKAVTDRNDGFFAATKSSSDIKIVAREDGKASVEGSLPVMENFLQSNPEIQAVYCINDPSCIGAYNAIKAANRTDIKLYSIDGSQEGIKRTCDGQFVGTSAQFPYKMGTIAAETVYKVLKGEKVEKVIEVDSLWINKDNCKQYLKDGSAAASQPAAAAAVTVDATAFADCAALAQPQALEAGTQASLDTISYKGGKMTLAYLPMGTEFNFHVALNKGIEDLTKKSDSDQLDSFMLSPYSGSDQAGQMGMLQDVTARPDVDAILLISFNEQSLAPLVEKAVQAGKAVIIMNSDIQSWPTPIHGVIGVAQFKVNHELYDWARTKLGDGPKKVAVLEGEPGYLNDQRSGGFKDGVKGSNWDIVSSVNGHWSVEKGNTAAMDVLQAHPDVQVIYGANDYLAQGAALAAEQLGRKDLVILGYDGDVNAMEDIARGKIYATTNASPVIMGRLAACYAINILNRKTTGGYVNTPTQIVFQDNVKDVLCKTADLYPKPSDEILKQLDCQ